MMTQFVLNRPVRWAIGFVGLVYLASLFFLPADGMWTVDNSDKYLQVQALTSSGLRSTAFNWGGQALAPEPECRPIPFPYAVPFDGRLHSFYSPVFALASTLPFKLFGFRGLVLCPLLAALFMLVGLASLAGLLGLNRRAQGWVVLAAGLATPVWFYSVTFWEHSLAVCFLVWSVVAAGMYGKTGTAKMLACAAWLCALAVTFRDDLYLFFPLMLGMLLWLRRPTWIEAARATLLFVAVAVSSLVPLWFINHHYTGSAFGMHLNQYFDSIGGISGYIQGRPAIFHYLLTALHSSLPLALALAAPIIFLLVVCPRMSPARRRWAMPIAGVWAAIPLVLGLWELFQGLSPIEQLTSTNSLFYASPIVALGLMRAGCGEFSWQQDRLFGSLARLVLAYAILYGFAVPNPANTVGIHWGNRFLLAAYPLLSLLAVVNILSSFKGTMNRFWPLLVTFVVVLSIAAQVYSINLLARTERFFARLNDTVEARDPSTVVSDVWWIPLQLYRLFPTRPIFLVKDPSCWQSLAPKLKEAKIDRVLDIRWNRGQDAIPASAERIDDDGLDFYGVTLQTRRLGNPE